MKKKNWLYGFVFLIVINLSALFMLAYNRFFPSASQDSAVCLQSELKLTGVQIQKMEEFRASFEQEIISLKQQIRDKGSLLLEEARKAEPDMAAVDTLIDDISRLQAQIQKKTILNLLKDKSILNPEQREGYFTLFETHVCGRKMNHRAGNEGKGSSDCPRADKKTENSELCLKTMTDYFNISWR